MNLKTMDIFCDVIDNFGDAGVSYRFVREMKRTLPELKVRLFTNGLETFSQLDGRIDPEKVRQTIDHIEYLDYKVLDGNFLSANPHAELVIEAFACRIPPVYYDSALERNLIIINLDHLSAEKWIEGVHLKESLTGGKAKKYFFMPGLTGNSGGLIPDPATDETEIFRFRQNLCKSLGLDGDGLLGTVFTYEHDFSSFTADILSSGKKTELVIFGKKSQSSFGKVFADLKFDRISDIFWRKGCMTAVFSPFVTQKNYSNLLKGADFNFVRGEDSWSRACLSGKPFVWHAYHQENNYQQVKVEAFNAFLKKYFKNDEIYKKYSEYQLNFNDRSDSGKDATFDFFLDNLKLIQSYNNDLSEFLIKNCNLIQNILFFVGSLTDNKN